jgi:hypothetical protein
MFVEAAIDNEYESLLTDAVASTIFGSVNLVADSGAPCRQTGRPKPSCLGNYEKVLHDRIIEVIKETFGENRN